MQCKFLSLNWSKFFFSPLFGDIHFWAYTYTRYIYPDKKNDFYIVQCITILQYYGSFTQGFPAL